MPELKEIESIIDAAQEGLGVEFKASMSWQDRATQAKVIKAVLAFANKRDGGLLIFGVEQSESPPYHVLSGMSETDFGSFAQDAVSSTVNAHATPSVDLSVAHLRPHDKLCVAIIVREFPDYPVLCSQDFVVNGKVQVTEGRLYCRSRRMAETTEVRTTDDMRDIIELAVSKGLQRYFRLREIERRVEAASEAERSQGPSADAQFRSQLADLE